LHGVGAISWNGVARVVQNDLFWADEVRRSVRPGLPVNLKYHLALRTSKSARHWFAFSCGCAAPKESFGATLVKDV